MQRYFSPSVGGFFSEDVHGARLVDIDGVATPNPDCLVPGDAIPIGDDLWRDLLLATSEGKIILIDGGMPVAVAPDAARGADE